MPDAPNAPAEDLGALLIRLLKEEFGVIPPDGAEEGKTESQEGPEKVLDDPPVLD